MEKNDCFLMKGSDINEPMTLYFVSSVSEDKFHALSICIKDSMVQALSHGWDYEEVIPEKAVLLPSGTYQKVKHEMATFLKEIKFYISNNLIKGDFKIEIGGHYYDGYIYTITEIGESKVKYDLFRLEEENISPFWSGESHIDNIHDYCWPISNETYKEVLEKYKSFVSALREQLYKREDRLG